MQNVHIGPFPPPLGGISVYIYRLSKIEINSIFIDSKKLIGTKKFKFWLIKQAFDLKKKNFICHSQSNKIRLIFYFLSCISVHKFSLVIHSVPLIDQYNNSNKFVKLFIRKMLNNAEFIQVANNYIKNWIINLKIKNDKLFVKPAFLPPPLEEEEKILKTFNKGLIEFFNKKKPLIIGNAAFLEFYNNQDLYGLDMCIELTKKLKTDHLNVGFLFALANKKENIEYLEKMKKRISNSNLTDNFYFMTGQKELWPLFKKADLFVRPTNVDGDSVSIREAIYFGVPVVASDVIGRPKGCYLFKNRNLNDLYIKCKEILKSK